MRDILVGDRNGFTMLYLETGSGLTLADTIRASGVKIDVGNNSNPEVNDWNEDGKKDLLIGAESGTGTLRIYLNQGTDANPVFTTFSYVYCAGSPIYHSRLTPRVYDLDGDGKKDLVISEQNSYIYLYKNVGTNASPVFNIRDTLRLTTSSYIHEYQAIRLCCADFNGDGAADLWTSDFYGYIQYYQNTVVPGIQETEKHAISSIAIAPSVTTHSLLISYSLTSRSNIHINVYSSDGRIVENVLDRIENAGDHHLTWHKKNLQPGIYFFKITINHETQTRKVIIL
jgi:hypothetical protein